MKAKLFVRNLSWSVTEDDLYALFSEVGTVSSVRIPTRREDGKPRGFAFVEMATPENGDKAVRELNGTLFHNRDLVVAFQEDNRAGVESSSPVRNAKLFVRNLPPAITETRLQEVFRQVGTVQSVKIPFDRESGEPRQFGFVEMASADEAQKAMERLNHTLLEGKELIVDFQDPNRNRNKPPRSNNRFQNYGGERSTGYADRW